MKASIIALTITLTTWSLFAKEYHVSTTGFDGNKGSQSKPFKTISAAAQIAKPGDTITVHEGVYRERVNPPRGGTSDDKRIVYRAAKGDVVIIKGSEVIKGWQKQTDGVWRVTIANSFFGDYNPYKDVIAGDWFIRKGRDHHTGEVYLNGKALFEEVSLDKLKERKLSWYCQADDKETNIWANFGTSNPNSELVEINTRPTCFYPDQPGHNYITVSGFVMRHAATQWAAPTSEQIALIGTHWSKGWIIENNVISDSKCVGVTLGKHGDEFDNTSADSAEGYVATIERALARGWSKDNIGSHIIRNNTIYNCGAAGICGSMGGVFSQITGNHIYNINYNYDKPFDGHEQAGIKIHAPIDSLIKNNRVHHTSRGIWLDWMTQGTVVSGNLLYDNGREDLYVEVNHGPFIVENNLFLTDNSLKDLSEGGSYSHNLFFGKIVSYPNGRKTPYHKAHSTKIAGLSGTSGGDNRFHNNILAGRGLDVYNNSKPPMLVNGNVYLNGAQPFQGEEDHVNEPEFNPNIKLVEENDAVYLEISLPKSIVSQRNKLVTTELLGKGRVVGTAFVNPDGSPLTIDTDYFGKKRNKANPTAGPFESPGKGNLRLKVWQVNPGATAQTKNQVHEADIVIYGGTSAAVTSAVQAQRMGKSVIVVSPDKHLGGLSSGGLGFTDTGNKSVIGGLSREFYQRIWKHYNQQEAWKWQKSSEYGNRGQGTPAIDGKERTMWIFEPHVAEQVFEDFVAEYKIPVHRDEWLDRKKGVKLDGARIGSITTLSGKIFKGKIFIDATYEGDLMAAAGVSYHVGREANVTYGEKWNGIQIGVLHHNHHFAERKISPYVIPDDPASGLLPRISTEDPGQKGNGDHRLQAYCFRMCLTDHPENRVPFPKPEGYDPKQYELLLRVFNSGWRDVFRKFDPIPNRKTDTNNHGPFSTDNIGMNYDYPDGSYDRRRKIIQEHETYQKGLMYFLANDSRVPQDIRTRMSKWGLAKDEFVDNGNWPHQLYIREARRMIGEYVTTENDVLGKRKPPKPVGMGSYTMDSHNVQRYIKPDGFVQNEGDIGVHPKAPYQIAYGTIIPKKNECENLLVPVCVSSSHIAFGSIRMEPVFMILGQSAATAASFAIDDDVAVQNISYDKLKKRLIDDKQSL